MVEQGLRDEKNVYDVDDFKKIIDAKGKCIAAEDFFEFPDGLSQGITCKTPLLKAVKVVQFRSGSLEMFWKETYEQEEFFASPFLKKKLEKQITKKEPFAKKAMKGISQARKDGL